MTYPVQAVAAVTGQPIARVDGRLKVTGSALYAADTPAPNLLYATLVCSTVSRGTVAGIDSSAARRARDVLRVFDRFPGVHLPYDPAAVAFFGQPVAVVAARTMEAAMHGASLVTVRYAQATQVTDIDSPMAVPQPGQRQTDYVRGDPDGALARARVVSDLSYSITRYNHNPMELPSTVASWDGDKLTVWDKAQGINSAQAVYGKAFGIPPANVRVICPFIGGAFGSAGGTWPHQILAAFVARQMRQPVKLRAQPQADVQRCRVPAAAATPRHRRRRRGRHHRDRTTRAHRVGALHAVRGQHHRAGEDPLQQSEHALDVPGGAST
jgi:xanthine dehydrogenase YagR molybdenum-binding subunit